VAGTVEAEARVELTDVLFVADLLAQPASNKRASAPARVSRDRLDIVMVSFKNGRDQKGVNRLICWRLCHVTRIDKVKGKENLKIARAGGNACTRQTAVAWPSQAPDLQQCRLNSSVEAWSLLWNVMRLAPWQHKYRLHKCLDKLLASFKRVRYASVTASAWQRCAPFGFHLIRIAAPDPGMPVNRRPRGRFV
jgi:hypothetical protein